MKKLLDMLTEEMQNAFEAAGYDKTLGRVTISNRPDLCEYQCNGAMAGAKQYKKAPIMIANEVAEKLNRHHLQLYPHHAWQAVLYGRVGRPSVP